MKRYAVSIVFCVLLASSAFAQTKSQVEGVWKIVEAVLPGTNPADNSATRTISNPQPGLVIFTRGYYSQISVTAEQPRTAVEPAKDPQNLTDAEKMARYEQWRQFAANAGTYEIKGTTLVLHALVAKNVQVMTTQTPLEVTFKLEGNTLLLAFPPGLGLPSKLKLTRLE